MSEKLYITAEHNLLTDLRYWTNRIQFKTPQLGRINSAVIDQHKDNRAWRCSCHTFSRGRDCAHLRELNLPGGGVPYEVAAIVTIDSPIRLQMLRLRQQRRVGMTKWEQFQWSPPKGT